MMCSFQEFLSHMLITHQTANVNKYNAENPTCKEELCFTWKEFLNG